MRLVWVACALLAGLMSCGVNDAPAASKKPAARAAVGSTGAPTAAWGGGAIRWQDAESGLAAAKAQGKRAMVVVSAEWCGHCRNYARVFSDPRILEQARSFVMIKLDADRDAAAARFAVDGGYVPRTFFVRPDGSIDTDIQAGRGDYRYFYNEHDPAPLLAAMTRAVGR